MKPARLMHVAAVVLMLLMVTTLLTGCWDSREINDYYILTGTAMDVSDIPDQIHVTQQVANIEREDSGSGESGSAGGGDPVILLNADSHSLLGSITEINRDSSHKLLFQHNQIRLFGIALAEQGVKKHLDLLMRDHQSRLEIPMAVVDGRAEEALEAKIPQEPISGIYMAGMFEDQSQVSVKYRVRLIDFVHMLLDEAVAPVMPIIKVTGAGDKQEIKMAGMAIFKGDKMIGRLTNDETLGYIWSFGNVQRCNFEVEDDSSRAVLRITNLDCKREVTLREDGGVRVFLSINSVLGVGELQGFKGMEPPELLKHLENLAQEEIKKTIIDCFMTAQNLNADIFGYCTMVYQKYPNQWNQMKNRWNEIFSNINFDVQVKVTIPATGQIVQSLEMEGNME